jgi:hypothetical protein
MRASRVIARDEVADAIIVLTTELHPGGYEVALLWLKDLYLDTSRFGSRHDALHMHAEFVKCARGLFEAR